MLYSSPHNVYPDLNYFFAPFCIPKIIQSQNNQNCNAERNQNLNITLPIFPENTTIQYPIWPNQIMTILQPKTVKIRIVNNEKEIDESPQSKGVSHDKEELSKSKRIFLVSTNHDLNDSTLEYSVDNISPISNGEITKFNTDPKLKKIHSIYHLKRKISTKLQNDIRNTINEFISRINLKKNGFKLPFLLPNSKLFREDVKNDTLKKIKSITISKYVCEDIQIAGRSLNIHNLNVSQKIEEKYFIFNDCDMIKLYNLMFKTLIYDYYEEFLNSDRFKKCFEKDLAKYSEKLKNLNYSLEKSELYKRIFKEKYEGIAKCYFTCS